MAAGEGHLIVLAGEPGAGKTRLAQEVTLHARERSFFIAAGSCYESRQAVPYYPFLDVLATLYRSTPPSIRSAVPRRWPYLGRLLPEAPISVPATALDNHEEQERLFRAVTGFIQTMAEEVQIALLLDDLHWADASSLQLLQHLARHTRSHRVLLLGTYRDVEVGPQHPLERALRDLRRDGLMERVAVRRLAQGRTGELLAAILGVDAISAELTDLVHRHTEGNPFFTQEVLRALVERGDVYRQNGQWHRRQIVEIEVPESVRSVIGERVSRLGGAAQEVLHEASVLGQSFSFDELQMIGDRSEGTIEDALEAAAAAGLIRETGNDGYAFNHALTQQTLYAEPSGRKRRRLHLAVGNAIEQLPERIRNRRVAELAWHFLEGDDPKRALQYAMCAGDGAEAIFAHAEAERQYRTALVLAQEQEDQSREADAAEKLGVVLRNTGRYDDALAALERAAALQHKAAHTEDEARVLASIGEAHVSRGTAEEAIERLERFLPMLSDSGVGQVRVPLLTAMSRLRYATGQYAEAAEAGEQAALLARETGDEHMFIRAEGCRLRALGKLGREYDHTEAYEELRRVAEAVGDHYSLCAALDSLGDAYRFHPDRGKSMLCRNQALEIAERLGDPARIAFMTFKLGWNAFEVGDWTQARAVLKRSLDTARSSGRSWEEPYALFGFGLLYVATGEWEQASEVLEDCIRLSRKNGDLQIHRHAAWVAADKDLQAGRPDLARARLEPLLDRPGLEEADVSLFLPLLAQAHLDMGDGSQAEAVATEAVRRARAAQDPDAVIDAHRVLGMVLAASGQWEAAAASLEEGLALARARPYPYMEARALYEQGRMCARKGEPEPARERLEQALAIFQRLGARFYLERTEQTLAELE